MTLCGGSRCRKARPSDPLCIEDLAGLGPIPKPVENHGQSPSRTLRASLVSKAQKHENSCVVTHPCPEEEASAPTALDDEGPDSDDGGDTRPLEAPGLSRMSFRQSDAGQPSLSVVSMRLAGSRSAPIQIAHI
jgi:hypothetical protein